MAWLCVYRWRGGEPGAGDPGPAAARGQHVPPPAAQRPAVHAVRILHPAAVPRRPDQPGPHL